jgi:hypothetical protein
MLGLPLEKIKKGILSYALNHKKIISIIDSFEGIFKLFLHELILFLFPLIILKFESLKILID